MEEEEGEKEKWCCGADAAPATMLPCYCSCFEFLFCMQRGKKKQDQPPHGTHTGVENPEAGHTVGPKSGTTVNHLQVGLIVGPEGGTINNFNNNGNRVAEQIQGVNASHIMM